MPVTVANRIRLFYEIEGSGPPLLVLGGTGWDLRNRPNLLDSVLVEHFTVLLPDQRGSGRSGFEDRATRMIDYADDAFALLQAVGWDRAHILGYSFGGMVAQHLAAHYPDAIAGLVLAAATAGGAGGNSFPLHELDHLSPRAYAERLWVLQDTRRSLADLAAPDAATIARLKFTQSEREALARDPVAAAGRRRQMEARASHDAWALLPHISSRTLVAAGEFDGQAPLKFVRRLAERIPRSRLVVYPGGHLFLREANSFLLDASEFLLAEELAQIDR